MGSYLHQLQEVPGREEAELDLRLQDLELTPQQLAMAASPESRLKKLTPVRYGVAAHMESRARIKAAIRHRTQKPGKWAQKLSARYKRKFAQEALQKLEAAGSLSALSNTIMPAARGPQALATIRKSNSYARTKLRKAPGAGQGEPEIQITYQMITDHPFLGEKIRIISPASHPAICAVAQLRKLHKNGPADLHS